MTAVRVASQACPTNMRVNFLQLTPQPSRGDSSTRGGRGRSRSEEKGSPRTSPGHLGVLLGVAGKAAGLPIVSF